MLLACPIACGSPSEPLAGELFTLRTWGGESLPLRDHRRGDTTWTLLADTLIVSGDRYQSRTGWRVETGIGSRLTHTTARGTVAWQGSEVTFRESSPGSLVMTGSLSNDTLRLLGFSPRMLVYVRSP